MMDNPADYPHLNESAKVLVNAPDAARIHSIRAGTWLGYKPNRHAGQYQGAVFASPVNGLRGQNRPLRADE